MSNAKELRERCNQLKDERREELKSVLNIYAQEYFSTRPFRAVIGNKRCKPIPIHKSILGFEQKSVYHDRYLFWPNFSKDQLRKELEDLGFVLTESSNFCISIPPIQKGKKLTFAQKWMKMINDNYSAYCHNQKKLANEVYSTLILDLLSMSAEEIKTCEGYTLFYNYKYNSKSKISIKCYSYVKSLMAKDRIAEFYENNEYKGIIVYH